MRLAETVQGTGDPLLIAHGLFGSARNWGVIAKRLAEDRRVIAVDMRNHGESGWDDDHSYPALAADLAEVIRAAGGAADVWAIPWAARPRWRWPSRIPRWCGA